jgi:hypothetical protein
VWVELLRELHFLHGMIRILDSEFSKQLPLILLVKVVCRRGKALGNKPSHYTAGELQPKVHLNRLWSSVAAASCALHTVHSQLAVELSCCCIVYTAHCAQSISITKTNAVVLVLFRGNC